MVLAPEQRVLYVSDSLGTPIHPRGIYNYSLSLMEMLKALGFHVTLMVERGTNFGVSQFNAGDRTKEAVSELAELSEIYRYFGYFTFHHAHRFEDAHLQDLVEKEPQRARSILQNADRASRHQTVVRNRVAMLDYLPDRAGAHLKVPDAFLAVNRVYSDSMTRGFNDMPPVPVDASGFDLVLIDTPHHVAIGGVPTSRVYSVVHDLIPLTDPSMSADWRLLFINKLRTTLEVAGNLIFVSETTRQVFKSVLPERADLASFIVYPTLRQSLCDAADQQPAGPRQSKYIKGISVNKPEERKRHFFQREARLGAAAHSEKFGSWNGSLPYFLSVLSDEPRKNIAVFPPIANMLEGRANFVVVGEIDGNRYMGQEPERYPNLHFTGYISEVQKLDLLRNASGMIFPSWSEGFGIPITEGALFGAPVFCSDIPVFREITDGKAHYFHPKDVTTLRDALVASLANRAKTSELAEALRKSVLERFSQAAMLKRLAEIFAKS